MNDSSLTIIYFFFGKIFFIFEKNFFLYIVVFLCLLSIMLRRYNPMTGRYRLPPAVRIQRWWRGRKASNRRIARVARNASEMKYYGLTQAPISSNIMIDVSATEYRTWSLYDSFAQGDSNNDRDGNKIKVMGMELFIQGVCNCPYLALRVMIVRHTRGYQAMTDLQYGLNTSPLRDDRRHIMLFDKTYNFQTGNNASPEVNFALHKTIWLKDNTKYLPRKTFITQWSDTTTGASSIIKNDIGVIIVPASSTNDVLAMQDGSSSNFNWHTSLWFKDF